MGKKKPKANSGVGMGWIFAGVGCGFLLLLLAGGGAVGGWFLLKHGDPKVGEEKKVGDKTAPPKLPPFDQFLSTVPAPVGERSGPSYGRAIKKITIVDHAPKGFRGHGFQGLMPQNLAASTPEDCDAVALLSHSSRTVGGFTTVPGLAVPDYGKFNATQGLTAIVLFDPRNGEVIDRSHEIPGPPPPKTLPAGATEAPPAQFPREEVIQYLIEAHAKLAKNGKKRKDPSELVVADLRGAITATDPLDTGPRNGKDKVPPSSRTKQHVLALKAGVSYRIVVDLVHRDRCFRLVDPTGQTVALIYDGPDTKIDLSISANKTGNYTAIVSAPVAGNGSVPYTLRAQADE